MSEVLLRHPSIAGDLLAVVAEDDVWLASLTDGHATRLTYDDALCSFPRLSPDGHWIAYSRRDSAGIEVHVVPTSGGEARRLTWLGGLSFVRGWTDTGDVLFTSDARQPFRQLFALHRVSPEGGEPQQLPLGPARDLALGPDGLVVVGRNTDDPARWKRNRGGSVGRLWVNPRGGGTWRLLLPDLDGNLASPMVIDGRVYFLSDHDGVAHLYSCRPTGRDLRRHTADNDRYARWATTDGNVVVFQRAGDIVRYDPVTGAEERVEVEVRPTRRRLKPRTVPLAATFGPRAGLEQGIGFDLAGDGRNLAVEGRGHIAVFDRERGPVRLLRRDGEARLRLPRFAADNVLTVRDDMEGEHLELHRADSDVRRLAGAVVGRIANVAVAPDAERAAVTTHRGELWLVDLAAGTGHVIDHSVTGHVSGPAWHPNGSLLAYSRGCVGDFIRQIRIYDLDAAAAADVTEPEFGDALPAFDPGGRYLYFLSARAFAPADAVMGFALHFPRPVRAFVATLDPTDVNPFDDPAANRAPLRVNLEGIGGRIRPLPLPPGHYSQIIPVADGALVRADDDSGNLSFTLQPSDIPAKSSVLLVPFDATEPMSLATDVTELTANASGQHLLVRSGRELRVLQPTRGSEASTVALARVRIPVQPVDDFAQVFNEAWQRMHEFFWTEDMGGVDWLAVRDKYAPLAGRALTRSDLSDVIWEMYGELGVSHAYEMPGDLGLPDGTPVAHLGADLSWSRRGAGWAVDRIPAGDAWDPDRTSALTPPGVNVTPGDRIVAVAGEPVSPSKPPLAETTARAGEPVTVTLERGRRRREATIRPLGDERPLRYRDWVVRNRRRVREASEGRVGYIHIPNMGGPGFAEFHRAYWVEFARDALIVDARFNEGGYVSTLLLEKLLRRRLGTTVYRWRAPEPYPRQALSGPVVGLCNEHTGSDGDLFSYAFRAFDIGPLVGVRTWGGVIGIDMKEPHLDGSMTAQPELAHWLRDVGWQVEGHGAEPSHVVEVRPDDEAADRDRQLELAVELALKGLVRTASDTAALAPPQTSRPRAATRRRR